MIGVRFLKAVRPYGAGDLALLPDQVAEDVIASGEAERAELPDAPHAHGAGESGGYVTKPQPSKVIKPVTPAKPQPVRQGR